MASIDGNNKVFSIDETLKKYGDLEVYRLVNITHKDNSPWSIVGYIEGKNPKQIKKDIIYKYHLNELI